MHRSANRPMRRTELRSTSSGKPVSVSRGHRPNTAAEATAHLRCPPIAIRPRFHPKVPGCFQSTGKPAFLPPPRHRPTLPKQCLSCGTDHRAFPGLRVAPGGGRRLPRAAEAARVSQQVSPGRGPPKRTSRVSGHRDDPRLRAPRPSPEGSSRSTCLTTRRVPSPGQQADSGRFPGAGIHSAASCRADTASPVPLPSPPSRRSNRASLDSTGLAVRRSTPLVRPTRMQVLFLYRVSSNRGFCSCPGAGPRLSRS